jgi:uncharacterized protein YkwD
MVLTALALAAVVGGSAPALGSAAHRATCPSQGNAAAPFAVQERAMLCLVNRVRQRRGLEAFESVDSLDRAADHKSADILRCGKFSHEACGRQFTYWITHFGYSFCAGAENIAWGSGSLGTPQSIFRSWMHSAGHRRNILGAFEDIGIGLKAGELEGFDGAHVWTQEFGSRDC